MTVNWEQLAQLNGIVVHGRTGTIPSNYDGTLRGCKKRSETWPREVPYTIFLNSPGIAGKSALSMEEFEALGAPPEDGALDGE